MAVVLEWVETGQVFPLPLGRPAVIGRSIQADICVPVIYLNRRHCQSLWDGCRVWVHDLESRNGTYLNGRPGMGGVRLDGAQGGLLRLGDVLHLGGSRLRLAATARVEATWLAWQGGLVASMAGHIHDSGDFGAMPVLADALEEAGCTDAELLAHCRSGTGHLRGCWAVDLLLGRG
jgi:hypothetical protein